MQKPPISRQNIFEILARTALMEFCIFALNWVYSPVMLFFAEIYGFVLALRQ